MPALQPMLAKHWRAMKVHDKNLGECLAKPPMTAFRRQANLRNHLIKSKLPPPPRPYPERDKRGMTNCGKSCPICPYIKYGKKKIQIDKKSTWKITTKKSCESFNVVYLSECQKENCQQRYIGTKACQLKFRMANHRGYIINQVTNKATGAHWNLPGHSLADIRVTILELTTYHCEDYRKEQEKYFFRIFDTYNNWINRVL